METNTPQEIKSFADFLKSNDLQFTLKKEKQDWLEGLFFWTFKSAEANHLDSSVTTIFSENSTGTQHLTSFVYVPNRKVPDGSTLESAHILWSACAVKTPTE